MNDDSNSRPELTVYVLSDCPGCARARGLARDAQRHCPLARVTVVDLGADGAVLPPAVFSVPTWLLNGCVFSLGNPDPARLLAALTVDHGRQRDGDS